MATTSKDDLVSGVETMRLELARVRARFSVDPTPPSHLFAAAWTSPSGVVEEDEAEFVDAVADCMSVGLSLGAAVAFWASGDLAGSDNDEDDDDDDDNQATDYYGGQRPMSPLRA